MTAFNVFSMIAVYVLYPAVLSTRSMVEKLSSQIMASTLIIIPMYCDSMRPSHSHLVAISMSKIPVPRTLMSVALHKEQVLKENIMDPVIDAMHTLPSHLSFSQKKLVSFVMEIHTLSIRLILLEIVNIDRWQSALSLPITKTKVHNRV
ncbi:hypothetical protein Tco_0807923 [Tanacetum coccineum]